MKLPFIQAIQKRKTLTEADLEDSYSYSCWYWGSEDLLQRVARLPGVHRCWYHIVEPDYCYSVPWTKPKLAEVLTKRTYYNAPYASAIEVEFAPSFIRPDSEHTWIGLGHLGMRVTSRATSCYPDRYYTRLQFGRPSRGYSDRYLPQDHPSVAGSYIYTCFGSFNQNFNLYLGNLNHQENDYHYHDDLAAVVELAQIFLSTVNETEWPQFSYEFRDYPRYTNFNEVRKLQQIGPGRAFERSPYPDVR